MSTTDPADRLAIARAFDKATNALGVGIDLGLWAGRGDWASCSDHPRDRAAHRALTGVEKLIEELTAFRRQLADAIGHDDGGAR